MQSGRNVFTTTFDIIHGGIRCLNLLHDHPKRDELLDVLIDAGESAWARGAHEVGQIFRLLKRFSDSNISLSFSLLFNPSKVPDIFFARMHGRKNREGHSVFCLALLRKLPSPVQI